MMGSDDSARAETDIKMRGDGAGERKVIRGSVFEGSGSTEDAASSSEEMQDAAAADGRGPEACDASGGRTLSTNDHIFVDTNRSAGYEGTSGIANSFENAPTVPLDGVGDSPAIQLGDPTLSLVNEFIDNEKLEKQKKARGKGFFAQLWCILTCGM
ncbi:hypothetical protein PAPHI01_1351 [Pancytospora philotis]|nr:hypothetical protein PAPHI01_1351 [Pancytospora philotis]